MVALVSPASTATLYDINLSTGATTSPRSLTYNSAQTGGFIGIATSPANLTYGISNNAVNAAYPAYAFRIFQVNRTTGSTSLGPKLTLNNQDYPVSTGDVAFDPTSGTLYGFQQTGALFTADVATGAVSVKGTVTPFANQQLQAMAFHSSGMLFMLDTGNGRLIRVNKANGQTTGAIPVPVGVCSAVSGMRFSGDDLYIVNHRRLYKVTFAGPVALATSVSTTVVGNTLPDVTGLSF